MPNLNKVFLMGHLGKDPEIRKTQSGTKQAKFSLATTEYHKDKNTGENRSKTDWHNVVAWGKPADSVERKDLRKGDLVHIEGKINYMAWDDPSGQKKYSTSITLIHLQTFKAKAKDELNQEPNGNLADPEDDGEMPW